MSHAFLARGYREKGFQCVDIDALPPQGVFDWDRHRSTELLLVDEAFQLTEKQLAAVFEFAGTMVARGVDINRLVVVMVGT
jgi:hypothetical protein